MCHGQAVPSPPLHRSSALAVLAIVTVAMLAASCADPNKTAARGRAELERHKDDPLIRIVVPGLRQVDERSEGAYVDQSPMGFHLAQSTLFVRTFAVSGITAEQGFAAFDAAVRGRGASLVASTCNISVPLMQNEYFATALGDHERVTVTVRPSDAQRPITFEVAITGNSMAQEVERTGLRDCLHRQLEPSAYVSLFAGRPRTVGELCDLLTDDIRRSVFDGGPGRQPNPACIIKGKHGGRRVYVQLVDVREQSLATFLDHVVPDTDPHAVRIAWNSGSYHTVLLPRLTTGALRVDSDDQNTADTLATLLLDRDASGVR